eukprot:7044805-Pyramimonas_sp.AAC.1
MQTNPHIVTIKYPVASIVKRYRLQTRAFNNGADNTWYPKNWKLQGSNDETTWTDIGDDGWNALEIKVFDVSFNSVAYMYFRLRITQSIYHDSDPSFMLNQYVAIEEWELETV